MKIETSILARRDGTVSVTPPSGNKIVFVCEDGRLQADVTDEKDLAFLLSIADFFPADEADHVQAEDVLRAKTGADDLPDDVGDENAAPIELRTPPKAARAPRAPRTAKTATS